MREKEGEAIPNWLSTHPSPPDRIKATESAAIVTKSKGAKRDYRIDAEPYLSRLEGLVYGEDPREGFETGGQFVHPDLRFQLDVPAGWKVQNAKNLVVMAEPQGTAVIQLILVPPTEGQSPEAIGRKIGSQQGAELVEGAVERIHGNQAFIGRYRVPTAQGTLGVSGAFISYGGHVFQISGLTAESSYSRMAAIFNSTLRSFRELTDPHLLNVQPDRITIHRSQAGETIRSLAESAKPPISAEELSRFNRITPDQETTLWFPQS